MAVRTAELTSADSSPHPRAGGVGCVHRNAEASGSQTSRPWHRVHCKPFGKCAVKFWNFVRAFAARGYPRCRAVCES